MNKKVTYHFYVLMENQFKKKLNYLNLNQFDIKKFIYLAAVDDIDNLFRNIEVLFSIWHESGSRLILEAYARGIQL